MRSLFLLCLLLCASQAWGQDDIDFNKARQLRQRAARGEKLSEEERAYVERAIQARRAGARRPAPATASPPKGLKPLTDMTAENRYKGEDGGLYGGGKNEPPPEHLAAALRQARQIQPLDRQGKPSAEGKVALISVGMSNTTQEFSQFQRIAAADPDVAERLVLVDGAQGGMEARAWARPDLINRPGRMDPWTVLDQRLQRAGVSPEQVQVAWIKQARANPAGIGEFPRHVEELKGHMQAILHKLKERFPNLRIAYLSSRIYAGYANGPLNPEPYAYESAFAVRRLIQEQIKGSPQLSYETETGEGKAPLLVWGPYLWADGEEGREFDDLVWTREDLAGDGTHPSQSGRQKVAEQLLKFFKTDPTAKLWFAR